MNRQEVREELKKIAAGLDALIGHLEEKEPESTVLERCKAGLEKCRIAGKLTDNQYTFYKGEIEQTAVRNDEAYLGRILEHLLSIYKGEIA